MTYRFGCAGIIAACMCFWPSLAVSDAAGGDYDAALIEARERVDGHYVDRQSPHPHFYPIGFTASGEFVYALTEAECSCEDDRCWYDDPTGERDQSEQVPCDPARFVGVVMVNLINDAVTSLTPDQARTFMEQNNVQNQDIIVQPFPLEDAGNRYVVTLEGHGGDWAGRSTQPPDEASLIRSIYGYLHSERHGVKRFFHFGESDETSDQWIVGRYAGFQVIGYIKSPFDDRIVVVMSYRARAQHDGVLRYVVAGAHLERGFSIK